MKLIPVVDLMRGQVVRAVRGNRQAYQPIVSQLCASSDPLKVAKTLCAHCDSRQLYVADLDALLGQPAQVTVLRELLLALPELELWPDAGFANAAGADALRAGIGAAGARIVPVFGSESLASRAELERCFVGANAADAVLSLDRRDGERLDAAGCWDAPALWPERVIVMTLERVGSDAGPDLDTLADVRRRSPATFIVGAGGIRNVDDLERAGAAGAGAWLVASALHDGRLPRARA
ncbi:MAG: nickel transporter [Rhizobacter sp.]|nr:nickel transporter [Rhizobacter sp.]